MEIGLRELAERWIIDSLGVKRAIFDGKTNIDQVVEASRLCADACLNGNKILFAGNGGSAADAQHLAGEFVSRFNYDRPGLSAFALTVDSSVLTSIGNDYGYEKLFSRQVEACAKKGDIFVGLTTSGNSPNVLNGIRTAREMGVFTIGFTGMSGGMMKTECDMCICVPSGDTPRIQEGHILLGHVLCGLVEQIIFPEGAQHESRGL